MKILTIESQIGNNLMVRFDTEPISMAFKWRDQNSDKGYMACILLDKETIYNLIYLLKERGLV